MLNSNFEINKSNTVNNYYPTKIILKHKILKCVNLKKKFFFFKS